MRNNFLPGSINQFSCGEDLEKVSDNIPSFLGDIQESMRVCQPGAPTPDQEYAACLGNVLATCGYIASAALELDYVPKACQTQGPEAPECSTTVSSGLQSLAVSATSAQAAAATCGDIDMDCGQNIAQMFTAVFDAQTGWSNVATHCTPGDYYHQGDRQYLVNKQNAKCASSIGAAIKSMAVLAGYGPDAAKACSKVVKPEDMDCGNGIANALASMSYLVQQLSEMYLNCPLTTAAFYGWYKCGANFERLASLANTLSSSIGKAVANCGLPSYLEDEIPEGAIKSYPMGGLKLPFRYYLGNR